MKKILNKCKDSLKLIFRMAINDFKSKYAGTYIGLAWAFIQPIISILIYWFIFEVAFNQSTGNNVPYIVWFACGMIPWIYISDCVLSGMNSIIEYGYLVKKTTFNINVLPIIKLMVALAIHLVLIALLIIICTVMNVQFSIYIIQIVYYVFCASIFAIGIAYIMASLIPFLKDIGQIMTIIIQLGFFLTPIAWDYSILSNKVLLFLFKLNPAFYIIQGYRDAFIDHIWFWQREKITIYFWIIALIMLITGIKLFRKLKPHFADVL